MPAGRAQFCTFFRFWTLLAMKGESLYKYLHRLATHRRYAEGVNAGVNT